MPPALTANEKKRLKALEQRKARQITYAKKHQGGKYSRRLQTTIAQIAKLTTRRANRRRDFTHKLTTDLAKSHGLIGIEDLRVKRGCGRFFVCTPCGHEDDADHNASVEIEARARRTGGLGHQQHAQHPKGASPGHRPEADA